MLLNNGHSIEITVERCLNRRYMGIECDYCIEHCPTQAIIYDESGISLDEDKCEGCALCLHSCPTGVFSSNSWDETAIISDIRAKKWLITEFFCGKHTVPYKQEKDQDRGAIRVAACLSGISRGAWYEIGLETEIELHTENCEGCPMQASLDNLRRDIYTVSEWIEASGHQLRISYFSQDVKGVKKKSLRAVESAMRVSSRRDFFLTITGKLKTAMDIDDKDKEASQIRVDESLLPRWHRRLAKVYSENQKETDKEWAHWPTIKRNDDCIVCGMCKRVCPTKALGLSVRDNNFEHNFTSGICIDCRACQIFCPKEAISRDRGKVEKPFEPTLLLKGDVSPCKRCGKEVYQYSDGFCYWCYTEKKTEKKAMDQYKKLFLSDFD